MTGSSRMPKELTLGPQEYRLIEQTSRWQVELDMIMANCEDLNPEMKKITGRWYCGSAHSPSNTGTARQINGSARNVPPPTRVVLDTGPPVRFLTVLDSLNPPTTPLSVAKIFHPVLKYFNAACCCCKNACKKQSIFDGSPQSKEN